MICSVKKEMTDKNGCEVVCEYCGGPLCGGLPGALSGRYAVRMEEKLSSMVTKIDGCYPLLPFLCQWLGSKIITAMLLVKYQSTSTATLLLGNCLIYKDITVLCHMSKK